MFIIELEPYPPALFLSSSSPEETMQSLLPNGISIARITFCRSPPLWSSTFHSTSVVAAKRKSKWDCKADKYGPKPSKSYIRYAVRQKRAEIKKALKIYLLYGKTSKLLFQTELEKLVTLKTALMILMPLQHLEVEEKPSFTVRHAVENASMEGAKIPGSDQEVKDLKLLDSMFIINDGIQKIFNDEYYHEHPETTYEAYFGRFRGFSWSQEAWKNLHFNKSGKHFEWKDESRWEREWSGSDDDDESTDLGSHLHRVTLGLPPTGPLKLVDVKSAFRISALKWHPDKHQGPSQAEAAEKFKLCVDAYNSLCSFLKAT